MRSEILLVALTASVAFAQEAVFIGLIEKIGPAEIQISTSTGRLVIAADDRTEVVKNGVHRSLSPLKAGDEVSVWCRPDPVRKFTAQKIWATPVSFPAVILDVRENELEVRSLPRASSNREQHKMVRLHRGSVVSTSRKQLVIGQEIWLAGFDVGDGMIDAARIAIYNADLPTDPPARR